MRAPARPHARCTPARVPAPDLNEFDRRAFADGASAVGRHKLGVHKWRADHCGGSGSYVPRGSDFEALIALGWSETAIRSYCRERERRMLAARRAIHGAPVASMCKVRATRESGEAVTAMLALAVDPANPTKRQRAVAEIAEALVELESVRDALATPPAA